MTKQMPLALPGMTPDQGKLEKLRGQVERQHAALALLRDAERAARQSWDIAHKKSNQAHSKLCALKERVADQERAMLRVHLEALHGPLGAGLAWVDYIAADGRVLATQMHPCSDWINSIREVALVLWVSSWAIPLPLSWLPRYQAEYDGMTDFSPFVGVVRAEVRLGD